MWKKVIACGIAIALLVAQGCGISEERSDLEQQLKALQSDFNALEQQNKALESEYESLQNQYDNLQSDFKALEQQNELLETLRIGHLLEDYYEEVRDDHEGFWWWLFSGGQQGAVQFAADLVSHNLGWLYWTDHEDTFIELSGGHHSDVVAKEELDEVISFIGIEAGDSSVEKIKKILEFVNSQVHYEYDMNEALLAPIETLAFGSGDCDDFAILAAALFTYEGIDSAVGFFSSSGQCHAMTLVHLNDLGSYDYYSRSDLTSKGLKSGKWIIIEPQSLIDQQHDSWVGQWNLEVASEIRQLH